MVAFPDASGVWQVRQVTYRTNDSPNVLPADANVRDLHRPVAVCDKQGRIIVLYRDNFSFNGLTIVHTLPYSMDPERTNWFSFDLTTDNLGDYEPVIDLARWQRDNVLDIVYQASSGEGYTPPANNASPIGVLEWNEPAYFNTSPMLQLAITNFNRDVCALVEFASRLGLSGSVEHRSHQLERSRNAQWHQWMATVAVRANEWSSWTATILAAPNAGRRLLKRSSRKESRQHIGNRHPIITI